MNEQSVLHDLVSRNEADILQRWVDRQLSGPAHAFPGHPGDEEVLRWIEQPSTPPFPIPHPARVGGPLDRRAG